MSTRLADEFIERINENIESVSRFCRRLDSPINKIRGQFDGGSDDGGAYLVDNLDGIKGVLDYNNVVEGPSGEIVSCRQSVSLAKAAASVFTDIGFWLHEEYGFGTGDDSISGEIIWNIDSSGCLFEFANTLYSDVEVIFSFEFSASDYGVEKDIEFDVDGVDAKSLQHLDVEDTYIHTRIRFFVPYFDVHSEKGFRQFDGVVELNFNIGNYASKNSSHIQKNGKKWVWVYDFIPENFKKITKKKIGHDESSWEFFPLKGDDPLNKKKKLDIIEFIQDNNMHPLRPGKIKIELSVGDNGANMSIVIPSEWSHLDVDIVEGRISFERQQSESHMKFRKIH